MTNYIIFFIALLWFLIIAFGPDFARRMQSKKLLTPYWDDGRLWRFTAEGYVFTEFEKLSDQKTDRPLFYTIFDSGILIGWVGMVEVTPVDPYGKPEKVWEFYPVRVYFPSKLAQYWSYSKRWLEYCVDVGREKGDNLEMFSFSMLNEIMPE